MSETFCPNGHDLAVVGIYRRPGRREECVACNKDRARRYREAHREERNATQRDWVRSPRGREARRLRREQDVEVLRHRARQAVRNAIVRGHMVKAPCYCGEIVVEAHHPNGYEAEHQLDIVWLCRPHHAAAHHPLVASLRAAPSAETCEHDWQRWLANTSQCQRCGARRDDLALSPSAEPPETA